MAHKTKASVKIVSIRLLVSDSVALALYSRIPAGIIIRMTMTYYATAMSYPRHTATVSTIMPNLTVTFALHAYTEMANTPPIT